MDSTDAQLTSSAEEADHIVVLDIKPSRPGVLTASLCARNSLEKNVAIFHQTVDGKKAEQIHSQTPDLQGPVPRLSWNMPANHRSSFRRLSMYVSISKKQERSREGARSMDLLEVS